MSLQQVADRLGASPVLSNPASMAKRTENIADRLPQTPFLAVASRHIQCATDAPPETAARVAAALALSSEHQEPYLKQVVDKESVDRFQMSLKFIKSLMSDHDHAALHREVCMEVGTVH